ncbi:hypothetical protein [Carnobacterium maltaromaticum]|uniref:hypothetical protein n=1 Tax=Carnobacterium maltaromaticum TaxID=2751 RepID=UPI001E0E5427|nr:hypothetical protein [Carnobacterium maltaromaticum]MCC4311603.1 hypothetical protein [Carnobacterium maltaromaticum]
MKVKSFDRYDNFKFDLVFENEERYKVDKPKYFETLIVLIVKLLDGNFSYDTSKNAFEIDSCINYLNIIYNSTIFTENIHNKKELYLFFRENDFSLRFFNESIRTKKEIAYPDFYTYFTGAYANLGVLYKILKRLVRVEKLLYKNNDNSKVDEFIFIRNKLLIHPEGNYSLANAYEDNYIAQMNEMDWHHSLEYNEDNRCMLHFYHKGEKRSVDLANNFLNSVEEICFDFLKILLENDKVHINDCNFSAEEHSLLS